jgi:hypothetical protein
MWYNRCIEYNGVNNNEYKRGETLFLFARLQIARKL